jgi:hypothetical protein
MEKIRSDANVAEPLCCIECDIFLDRDQEMSYFHAGPTSGSLNEIRVPCKQQQL